jgi:hypothetical protein
MLCKVHAFGIGAEASVDLIKSCAVAGNGHYYFIDNPSEIEEKVLESL